VRAAFFDVRDILYAAQYQLFQADHRLQTAVGEGCTRKVVRLSTLLATFGLTTQLRRVPFRWTDVLVGLCDIPDRLFSSDGQMGLRWHFCLSVKLPHREIVVDPTRDAFLHHTGLPVNMELKPDTNMALPVPVDGIRTPWNRPRWSKTRQREVVAPERGRPSRSISTTMSLFCTSTVGWRGNAQ
jgi:hypothetical protein